VKAFELYRFTHADGTAKEWGYSDLGNGTAEIRWGPEGQLRGSQLKPLREAQGRAADKLRKGYRHIGTNWLDDSGSRVSVRQSRPTTKSAVDLSALLGEGDGFYF
jgi:hypothetical protein